MTRTRKIMIDDVLDAAERVVVQLGAAGLSLDAVAKEAGISKTRVVYDFKSKAGLLSAMIERSFRLEEERLKKAIVECADTPHPELFGRLMVAARMPTDFEKSVVLAIASAAPAGDELQKRLKAWTDMDLKAMERGGARPHAARMAYLALNGLCSVEWFSMYQWTEEERRVILDGVRTIYEIFPEPEFKTNK